MTGHCVRILLIFLFVSLLHPAAHAEDAPDPCEPDHTADCLVQEAVRRLEGSEARETVVFAKDAAARHPGDGRLAVLLARSYLASENPFWTLRTLNGWLTSHPGDCDASLWLAWTHLGLGALDEARYALDDARCPPQGPWQARRDLLVAMIARHGEDRDTAREALSRAVGAPQAFSEDREALFRLRPELDPWYVTPLAWRLELWAGYTTNARAGSPQDPAQEGRDAESAFGNLSASVRFTPNFGFWLHPSLEADLRLMGYAADVGRDYSFLLTSGRPGLLFGGSRWSVLAAYRVESLSLAGGDRYASGPLSFYLGHRGELEVSPLPWLTIFMGGGLRDFRERGRDRSELDGGVGAGYRVAKDLQLMGALSARWQNARNDAYDLAGLTLVTSLEYFLPYGMSLRGGFSFSLEHYPHSAGFFDPRRPDLIRRDYLVKPQAGFWSPGWKGLRAGLVYEFAERMSRAEPYDYRDHRVMVKVVWPYSLDPWLPSRLASEAHSRMDWGLLAPDGAGGERIQDLIRQDEAVQRGSSCVE